MLVEESDEPTVMVEVAVADDQGLNLLRVGADKINVVVKRFGGISEVNHHSVLFGVALRFNIQRQAPLIVQRPTIVGLARGRFNLDAFHLTWTQEQIVGAVNKDMYRDFIDDRRSDWGSSRDLDTAEAASRRSPSDRCPNRQ